VLAADAKAARLRRIVRRAALRKSGLWLILSTCVGLNALAQDGGMAAQDHPPDAVIERWDQEWSLLDDGSQSFREIKHVRVENDRAYGGFADPRITFDGDRQEVEVRVARTRLPDGRVIDVPSYARNEVSPGSSAGWPAYAGLRQLVLTMSGLEPGAVIELDYVVSTRSRQTGLLAADVRLDDRYPIRSRSVRVSVPMKVALHAWSAPGVPAATEEVRNFEVRGIEVRQRSYGWAFSDVPAHDGDPQAPPWQVTSPRLTFSTAVSVDAWLSDRFGRISDAVDDSPLITSLAQEWSRDQTDPADKLRAIRDKLGATFNFVDFDVDWRPLKLRPASQVLRSNYGLPEEATSLLLALARAAGVAARPAILVADAVWVEQTPQDRFIAAYVVKLGPSSPTTGPTSGTNGADAAGPASLWSARHGAIARDTRWADHTLISFDQETVARTPLPAWGAQDDSRCVLRGTVTVAADGKLTGKLTLRTRGLFASREGLRTRDAQQGRVSDLVRRLLPDLTVANFSVTTLTPAAFEAEVDVKRDSPLDKLAGNYRLALGEEGPAAAEIALPLGTDRRRASVRLTGPFEEEIDLVIQWPEGWTVAASPAPAVAAPDGAPFSVRQTTTIDGARLTIRRRVEVGVRDVGPEDFRSLRRWIQELRSEPARTLLLTPNP
jgi:transglutaminase-like putative cysteine protease